MKKKLLIVLAVAVAVLAIATGVALLVNHNIQKAKRIDKIYVSISPDKVNYYVGDMPDYDGLKVIAVHGNRKTSVVDLSDCTITGFDSSKAEDRQRITVQYGDLSCSFTVNILELPQLVPTLSAVQIKTMPKTIYRVGDAPSSKGGVLELQYSDGSTLLVDLMNSYIYGFPYPNDTPGDYELTVKYSENGVLVQTTYMIHVAEE